MLRCGGADRSKLALYVGSAAERRLSQVTVDVPGAARYCPTLRRLFTDPGKGKMMRSFERDRHFGCFGAKGSTRPEDGV